MIISNKYLSLFRWLICKYLDISTFKGTCVYIYIHMYHLIDSLLSIQGKKTWRLFPYHGTIGGNCFPTSAYVSHLREGSAA